LFLQRVNKSLENYMTKEVGTVDKMRVKNAIDVGHVYVTTGATLLRQKCNPVHE